MFSIFIMKKVGHTVGHTVSAATIQMQREPRDVPGGTADGRRLW